MKQIILYCLSLLLSLTSLWGQQTIDLLDYVTKYMRDPEFVAERGLYIEDQRGVLHPFVGSWVGEYGDYAYEFSIEILKKRSIANGKKFADGLSVICHIYKRDDNGKWRLYLSNGSVHSEEKIREFYSLMYHPKLPGHNFLYRSTLVGQKGDVALKVLPEGGLQLFYYEPDYKYKTISGPQAFPLWDTYRDQGEAVLLRRVPWEILPYAEQGERNEVQGKLYQMIRLGRRFIQSEHFNPKFTNRLSVVDIDYKESMANGIQNSTGDLEGGEPIIQSTISSGVRQSLGLGGRYEILFDRSFLRSSSLVSLSSEMYHRYYQAYMLYVLSQRRVDLTHSNIYVGISAPRDYFEDLARLYMREIGLSVSQFKQAYLDLGMRLFELGDFGDTKQLRRLLQEQVQGL